MAGEQAPEGWYDDPQNPGQQRRWDGTAWTDERRPTPSPPPPGDDAAAPATDGKKAWWKRPWGIGLIILGLFLLIGMCADPEATDEPTASETQTEAPTEPEPTTETDAPDDVEPTTPEPEPAETTETIEPEPEPASIETAITDELGEPNREGAPSPTVLYTGNAEDRIIVTWAISDNLTENMIRRGAKLDAVNVLRTIREYPDLQYAEVFLEGTFSMVDQYGNAEESTVVRATYTRDTIEKINFDNFLTENAWEIADSAQIHPAFQDE